MKKHLFKDLLVSTSKTSSLRGQTRNRYSAITIYLLYITKATCYSSPSTSAVIHPTIQELKGENLVSRSTETSMTFVQNQRPRRPLKRTSAKYFKRTPRINDKT